MSQQFRVVADRASCCGYGVCADICPSIYKLDGNGIVTVPEPLIPDDLLKNARDGADACPQGALQVVPV